MRTIEHWIGGKLTPGSSGLEAPVYNPATGEQQASVVLASARDVSDAVAAAEEAFEEWSQTSVSKRAKVLFAFRELVNRRAHDIAGLIVDEHGKVFSSERDPSPSVLVAELWQQAGLPDGVFNVVHGGKVSVDAILDDPRVAAVSFVGSTPIARYIHERGSANGKRVQALGGAKNHAIVMRDADIDFTAEHLAAAAFGSAGERCMAISAAVAVGTAAEAIVEAVSAQAWAVTVGSGRDTASQMGPVVTRAAQQRIEDLIATGEAQGARLAADGRGLRVPGFENGFFVGPTVIDQVSTEMDVYREEIFGPVLSVVRVDTVDDAIAMINANPYGNGTAIFTSSGESARRFQRGVKVGMIGINVPVPVPMAFYSFGGWKDSLFGDKHVHGAEGISFYTRAKVITSRWPEVSAPTEASYSFPTAN